MIDKSILDSIRALPKGNQPYRDTDDLESSIDLYDGILEVQHEHGNEICQGSIFFRWLPSPTLRFEAATALELGRSLTVRIPSTIFEASGFASSHSDTGVVGILNGSPRLGTATECDTVWFQVANFHDLIGEAVRLGTDSHPILSNSRLSLPHPVWQVTIDRVSDYSSRLEKLEERGGFAISHTGCIRRSDGGMITVAEADQILSGLHFFLSFARGMWCTPIFPRGLHGGEMVWEQVASWRVTEWKPVQSWFPTRPVSTGASAWAGFLDKWLDLDWQYPLKIAIHWYVEANTNAGAVEGAVVLTQTALELLAWAVMVEERGLMNSKAFKTLSAAEKIRTLLRELQIPSDIPKELSALADAAKRLETSADPEILVRLRNGIIHSSKSKRNDIAQIVDAARWQALQFGLWCVELAILRICNYTGAYSDRLRHKYAGEVNTVPRVP